MDAWEAKDTLIRLGRIAIFQSCVEPIVALLIAFKVLSFAGLNDAVPWECSSTLLSNSLLLDGLHLVVVLLGNALRGCQMRDLLVRLAATGEMGAEPDIQEALGDHVKAILVAPCALCQWYLLQFVVRGACGSEMPGFALLVLFNFFHCAVWIRTLKRMSWGKNPVPEVESIVVGKDKDCNLVGHNCVICLGDLAQEDDCGRLPCGHAFHEACIRAWLGKGEACPMRCKTITPASTRESSLQHGYPRSTSSEDSPVRRFRRPSRDLFAAAEALQRMLGQNSSASEHSIRSLERINSSEMMETGRVAQAQDLQVVDVEDAAALPETAPRATGALERAGQRARAEGQLSAAGASAHEVEDTVSL